MKLLLTLSITLLGKMCSYAQSCDCKTEYNWLKETFEKNDAGFRYIIDRKGIEAYNTHSKFIENKVSKITDYYECKEQLENWVKFFRNNHFSVSLTAQAKKNQGAINTYQPVQSSPIVLEKFKKELIGKKENTIEGIWHSNHLVIAIKNQNNEFVGSVLESKSKYKVNDVVFKLNNDLSSATYYSSNYKPETISAIKYLGNNVLQIGDRVFERKFPIFNYDQNTKEYYQIKSTDKPFGYRKDEHTIYVYIPSFDDNKKEIDQLFKDLHSEIIKTENLIIDIRDNTGGQDQSYSSITPYLYTNPIQMVLAEFYSTDLNNQPIKAIVDNPNIETETKKMYQGLYEKLEANKGQFVNILSEKNVATIKKDKVFEFPKNVGIIINENNLSSAEEFLLMAKQSRKVKLFGRKSAGALDVSNMVDVISPSGDFELSYCVSRSMRIPENAVDDMGINPDYYLDSSISDDQWIKKVSEIMSFWK